VTALIAGMAVGRALGGRWTVGRDPDRVLLATLGVSLAGYLVVFAAPSTAVAVAGLVLVGLGLALQFPLNVTRLIGASGGRPDLATARQSLGAGLAIGLGPFALGAAADAVGVSTAFYGVPALLVLAAVGVLTHPVRSAPRSGAHPSAP
jgi:predicted MFS family arabinose efflux permease